MTQMNMMYKETASQKKYEVIPFDTFAAMDPYTESIETYLVAWNIALEQWITAPITMFIPIIKKKTLKEG